MQKFNLITAFEQSATKYSDNIAVSDSSTKLTFKELELLARKVATHILQTTENQHNSNIAIVLDSSAQYVAAMFGVWLSGNVVVPMESGQPAVRVSQIIEQCGAKSIVNQEFMSRAKECEPYQGSSTLELSDTAALFFTSGSTGRPKGIIHTLESFSGGVQRHLEQFDHNENDVFGYSAPFYFIAQNLIYPTLLSGGRVDIVPTAIRRSIKELEDYIKESGITQIFLSPSLLKYYENQAPQLRRVFTGSERVSRIAPSPEYQTMIMYGMSETCAQVTYFELDKEYENTPIGKAFNGVECFVLDDNNQEVADGEEGEICLKGVFTKGYYNDTELTEKLFKGGFLHTNDIGKRLEDGNLVYVNRKNWMLKINGQRVEPGEIEAVMKEIPAIDNAIVKGFERDGGQAYMCAYYIATEAISAEQIKAKLEESLPSYMIPSYFTEMDKFPINNNGKLDRLSLTPPQTSSLQSEYVAPTNEVESQLCKAFSEVLKVEKIGIDDNFVALGGDSILSIRLQTICPDLALSSKIIYAHKTPRNIAKELENQNASLTFEKLESYPLSQTQLGIYAECVGRRGEICYNNPRLFTLGNKIDIEQLTRSIKATIEAHPYIKTKIETSETGEPLQRDNSQEKSVVTVKSITNIEDVKDSLVQPFDIENDNLYRFEILKSDTQNYLFLDLHHIIFDGTSFEVLINDIEKAYRGEELEQEKMNGFQVAQLELLQRSESQYIEAKKWHEEIFSDVEVVSLPVTDYPEFKEGDSQFQKFTITSRLAPTASEELCQKYKVTENVLFNAAFSYFLATYNNDKAAFFATIYNGRSSIQTASTIAMMVKTLPLYTSLEGSSTLEELLQITKDSLLGAMSNDLFSFAEVCQEFELSSELLFAYQGDLKEVNTLCGEEVEVENLLENATGSTISVQVFKENGKFVIDCQYNAETYSEGLMRSFIESFDTILSQLPTKSQLAEIEITSPEQLALLDSFNQTDFEYDDTQTLVSQFKQNVEKYPNNTAVVFKENRYTYAQLDEISDRVAAYISGMGIGRDDVVSVMIPRSEYMAIATYGVLKSGAIYQPLDPTYPRERLNFMMEDASAKLLISTEDLLDIVDNKDIPTLLISDIPELPKKEYSVEIKPEDKYVILYTSGSTGQPKGCLLTHGNMVSLMSWYKPNYGITPEDRVTAYASYGFDASMLDTYQALCHGASLYIIPEEMRLNLIEMEEYFNDNQITFSFITTQVGRQFALSAEPTSLKQLGVGGEKLTPLTPPSKYRLHNFYGPSECTIYVTDYQIKEYKQSIPIGKALGNVKLYVVDSNNRRVPVGALGELLVAGPQVGAGYLNRDDLTEKVFIPNPYDSDKRCSRVYRTGDIVRYLGDGNVEFIGRRDSQVKIRGFRIELSEVEAIIGEFPGVDKVTVQAYDKESGGKFIAAYIVAEDKIDINALSDFVLENKPPYILPEFIMQIDQIPLTVNQKVDKKALPKPELQSEEANDSQPRELNILEKEIKAIVLDALAIKDVSITTPLAYAGLSSITSIKLAMLLFKRFGVSLDSKQLIKRYTIIDIENDILALILLGGGNSGSNSSNNQATSRATKESYPLSAAQMGVYIDSMKNPTLTTYNIPLMLKFPKTEELSSQKIADTVEQMVKSSPTLSLRFEMTSSEVQQIISPCTFTVERAVIQNEEELEKIKINFVRPFNLSKGGLCRALLIEGSESNYLMLDFHHLVFDGSSCDLFINNLTSILSGGKLEASSYSYLDFMEDELKQDNQQAEEFYHKKLSLIDGSSDIPSDLNGKMEDGTLKEATIEIQHTGIDSFCTQHSITPAQLLLAALHYTTARFSNSATTCLNTVSSGRSNLKISQSYGMFVNTLPLTANLGEQTTLEYIKECASDFELSIENENYPFAKLATKYNLTTNLMYSYLVGVLNSYKVGENEVELVGLDSLLTGTKSKLSIHIEKPQNYYQIIAQYNDALYSKEFAYSFVEAMSQVVCNFIENSSAKVNKTSMVTEAQMQQLIEFKERALGEIDIELFHQGVEKYAIESPNTMALIASDRELTYAEFNAEANKIANALLKRGITPGSRIALLMPRSSSLILSMFGVMKAAGAYIPCDPEYPTSRIEYILEDSEAKYIITTRSRASEFEQGRAIIVEDLLEESNTENPNLEISSDSLAYLIYTSGSTGKPKGVMLHHKGIANYLTAHPSNIHVYDMVNLSNSYLSVTTISFDMCLKEIGVTLFNGKTLVFANEDEANNPILLAELFERTKADCFNSTASRMLGYLEYEPLKNAIASCKVIMSGGENYPLSLLTTLQEISQAQIFNTYGPTEITVSSNAKNLTKATEISIGRPLYNYKEYIVDSNENLLPIGVVGELYIGGIGVAVGYNNLEEMTKDKFIMFHGDRFYKSGDYAKWTTNGDVVILGRKDNQIKLRGLRIEIGEIESAMSKIEGISRVAIKIVKINDKEHICGYFTATSQLDTEAIKNELKIGLTHYMVPTLYMQLDQMPLTPNGKTDMKALPVPTIEIQEREIEAARGKTEEALCAIFAKVLGVDQVGATDNFFDLGGTSLTVTRIIIESQKEGLSVAYGDLFANPTPRSLSDSIKQKSGEDSTDTEVVDYNYSQIEELLQGNTLASFTEGEKIPLGNVLLTGATGFLGIHILRELLENYSDSKVYCLIRDKANLDAQKRLKSILYYYFETAYEELFQERLFIVSGDVTSPDIIERLEGVSIQTVINCAANVKHFSKGSDIEDTNIGGVTNLIEYCKSSDAKLIHISTMSIGGMSVDNFPKEGTALHEQELYLGQLLDNKYIHSKFLAERYILEAVAKGELEAKIMRVGNLSARNSDGEFQINFSTNSFMGRLRSFNLLSCAPYETLDSKVEFSPIDEVSTAILLLGQAPTKCTVFHPFNHHLILLVDIFREMTKQSLEVKSVDMTEYQEVLNKAKGDEKMAKILSSIIAYEDMGHGKRAVPIAKHNAYTMQVLYRMGFHWSTTSTDYIARLLSALVSLGYFDKNI